MTDRLDMTGEPERHVAVYLVRDVHKVRERLLR
jgi:hypothetical protein